MLGGGLLLQLSKRAPWWKRKIFGSLTSRGQQATISVGPLYRVRKGRNVEQDWALMLKVAIDEARAGLAEGGIPIGAAMFDAQGRLLSSGRNRRVQQNDPSVHGETDAFRRAGRLRSYRNVIMVTTLAPCWYCSGLVRQFGIPTLVVGESRTFAGGLDWLRAAGVRVIDLDSEECVTLLQNYIREYPEIWHEDIGEE
jgi:creatinine deaminase